MFKLYRKIRNWFLPKHEGPFGWSPEEFQKARRWAKSHPHPTVPQLSLWDFVNSNHIDSEYKLNEINKVKQNSKSTI
jgi:hypothetical protein|tara:strand:- start:1228 stop:1458 length:231 start_codon:yes stop_codon:yes gene_type:complete